MAGELAGEPQALGPDDADEVLRGPVKLFINNNIIELTDMRDLPALLDKISTSMTVTISSRSRS